MYETPYPYEAQAAATPMWVIILCLLVLLVIATIGWFPIGVRFGRRVSSHLIVVFVVSTIPGFFAALLFGGEAGVVVFTLVLLLVMLLVSIACIVSFDRICRQRGFRASELHQLLRELGTARENAPGHASPSAHLCPECGTVQADDAPEGLCPRCLLHSGLGSVFPSPSESGDRTGMYRGPFTPPTPVDLARFFPQIEILELLGQGGMGAVYKARQIKLDRIVALKILPPEWGKDPAFAERFMREARALAKLCHPHIVAVHDFGETEGLFYFVMEYVDGANLRQVLQAGQIPPDEALRVVPQLCDALQYAHEEGIVHRDIKPENILLDHRGRVKVADFGLAKLVGPTPGHFTLTGSRQVVGTPHYMAPEQMEKPQTVDHRADIYSLGVVFYEMLTGELPLGRFALPSQKAAVDARLDEVVLRTLAKEPGDRYQRVSAVKTDLEEVTGQRSPGQSAATDDAFSIRFPFTTYIPAGMVKGDQAGSGPIPWHGHLRFDGNALLLEFEGGVVADCPREKSIPLSEIKSLELNSGWRSTLLVLQADRLSTLAGIPSSKLGLLKLHITREHHEAAERLLMWGPEHSWRVADLEKVRREVTAPATGLLFTGILALASWVAWTVLYYVEFSFANPRSWWLVPPLALLAVFTGILLVASSKMRRLESYELCKAASILAMLPWSVAFAFGLPAGCWAYQTLRRSKVRVAFLFNRGGTRAIKPVTHRPEGILRRKMHSLARAARYWVVDSSDTRKDQSGSR